LMWRRQRMICSTTALDNVCHSSACSINQLDGLYRVRAWENLLVLALSSSSLRTDGWPDIVIWDCVWSSISRYWSLSCQSGSLFHPDSVTKWKNLNSLFFFRDRRALVGVRRRNFNHICRVPDWIKRPAMPFHHLGTLEWLLAQTSTFW
jgi:hypothetical protein